MSCRSILALVTVALVGCADNTIIVDVPARATFDVELGPSEREPLADDTSYRWELIDAPEASTAISPEGGPIVTFHPDLRGVYLVERWIVFGLSDRLTHRFVVAVDGVPPAAVATATPTAAVGAVVVLDGAASASLEQRELIYRWRLTERPRDSAAVLIDADSESAQLTPDIKGTFSVELAVFDGELWSSPHATLQISVL